jgi:hypothetical protein
MAELLLTDELKPNQTVNVTKLRAVETLPIYDFAYLPSSTGSGVAVATANSLLHAVVITNTGASGSYLVLANEADSDSACPGLPGASASALAKIYLGGRGKYIFDALVSGKLCYLLSGQHTVSGNPNCDGITILYKLV